MCRLDPFFSFRNSTDPHPALGHDPLTAGGAGEEKGGGGPNGKGARLVLDEAFGTHEMSTIFASHHAPPCGSRAHGMCSVLCSHLGPWSRFRALIRSRFPPILDGFWLAFCLASVLGPTSGRLVFTWRPAPCHASGGGRVRPADGSGDGWRVASSQAVDRSKQSLKKNESVVFKVAS